MKSPIWWKEIDRQIWEEELESCIPDRIFDVHTHIYDWSHTINPRLEPNCWQEICEKSFRYPRQLDSRTRVFLHNGSWISRFRTPLMSDKYNCGSRCRIEKCYQQLV